MSHSYNQFVRISLVVIAIAALSLSSASAYAMIDLSPKTSLNTNANVDYSLDTDTSVDVDGKDSEVNSNANGSVDVSGNVENGRDEEDSDNSGGNTTVTAESEETINVNRSSLRGENRSEVGEERRAVIIGPGDVRTFGDLRAFAKGRIEADENLDELNFTNRAVEVRYNQPGRFLALVPVTMKVKITVNADGGVEVKYPWYSLFTLDNEDQIEAKIKVAVDNTLKGRLVGSVQADGQAENPTMTASELARIVESIQAAISANLDVEGESNTSVSTTNSTN